MAVTKFAENYYSFRKTDLIYGSVQYPRTPDQSVLAEIEGELAQANSQYLARQYNDAIGSYQQARSLIYAQLDPGFPGTSDVSKLPVSAQLFGPLLSASLEWMNILPVQQALPSVRPRVPVDAALFGRAAVLDQLGVISSQATSPAAANTIADWQMSQSFRARGFDNSAKFFLNRANASGPELLKILSAKPPAAPEASAAGAGPVAARTAAGIGEAPTTLTTHLALAEAVRPAPGLTFSEVAGASQRQPLPPAVAEGRTLGAMVDGNAAQFKWNAGDGPPLDQIQKIVYQGRVSAKLLPDILLNPQLPSDIALSLPHAYYYVIPLGLAECYHALGDFARAETFYFQAASYQFLNSVVEAPYVWQRLATLYLDWGNSLFRDEDAPSALPIYQHVLMADGTVPNSTLYTTASLKPGADQGRAVIANLGNLANITTLGLNPVTAAIVVEVQQQITKIQGGLDFWGFYAPTVPIWTFDYLQNVAVNFTQLAITAERDVINFWDRADQATLTRQQLSESVQQAQAEVQAAQAQVAAAAAEAQAYAIAKALADQRALDAQKNANDYAATSALAIQYSACQSQVSGGDDGDPNQLNQLADQLMSGSGISGSQATVAAADALVASRYNRQYEVAALQRQAAEMQTASAQAQAEVAAANARTNAAQAAVAVASLRSQAAQRDLQTFDAQTFTADVWHRMGDTMYRLYRRYLTMALRAARMMQRAYNFETDQSLKLIKGDYSTDEVKGLLGADSLMADIQTFTYELITTTAGKPQPLKQTVSLAQQYGYLFETQFRKTGRMQFETRIEDFDQYYPGTYAGRVDAVEVQVDGIVPVTGISGTLTNSGVSQYRLPDSLIPNPADRGIKFRVQSKETLVLSDYSVRQDSLLEQQDQRLMRIFQGAGVASSWLLELPKAINDIDYGALTDVRITFYYKARYDPDLHTRVLNQLAALPGITGRQRSLPLRWVYPDAFFRFQDTGNLKITLRPSDFRGNETKPVITAIGVLIATDGSVPGGNLTLSLSTPTHAAISAKTDANGAINSDAGPWVPLAAGTALGDFQITMTAADNPQLVAGGKLSLAPIVNLVLLFGYSFTPKA